MAKSNIVQLICCFIYFQNCYKVKARFSHLAAQTNSTLHSVDHTINATLHSVGMSCYQSFYSVKHPIQHYFSSHETGQTVSGSKRENPEKKHLAQPQAELCLSLGHVFLTLAQILDCGYTSKPPRLTSTHNLYFGLTIRKICISYKSGG